MTVTTNDEAPLPEPPVPGGPLHYGPPLAPQRRRSGWVWVAAALALVLMLAIGAVFVRVPYYAISPGSARQVDDLIRVDDPGKAYPPKGDVLLTTVTLGPVRNVYDALGGWLDPAVDVLPEEEVLGPAENRQQYNEANLQAMTDSKQLAEYVAFRHLGYDVSVTGKGALVVGVLPGTGAASALQPGDVIVAAEGQPVTLAEQLVAIIRTKKPGDPIRLSVTRADDESQPPRDVEVKLSRRDDGTPLLGITQQTWKQEFHFPFAVNIDSGQIGGPSAGLAFTLAVLDVLTPGELTGGQRIAATGTIDPDGNIGPVGGVAQKTVAVKRAGATVFLVPKEEYAQAKARAGDDLRVEMVETLADALRVLASLDGSNALALGAPGAQPQ
jgi:PDZ domain-containing protein